MLPTNVEDRKKILHFAFYEPTFRTSPYFEEALADVSKVCIEYNFRAPPDEYIHFASLGYPLLAREEFLTASAFVAFIGESDEIYDDPRHKMIIRVNQLDSLYSATTMGKAEPYTYCADFLLYLFNRVKSEYLKTVLKQKYLTFLDEQRRCLNKSKTMMSVKDVIKFRIIDFFSDFMFSITFLDLEDPRKHEEFLNSELGMRMANLASENIVIMNDIASLKIDKTSGTLLNIVISWMKENDESEDEAIESLSLKAKELYLELLKTEQLTQDPVGLDVLKRLLCFTSGHVYWSVVTPRYRK